MNIFSGTNKVTIKKTILLTLGVLLFSLLFSGALLFADSNGTDEHGKPLNVILQEIRKKQGLGPDGAIDPRTFSEKDLEELGEAIMSVMHPDSKQHEFMDNMMGGEGSESLAAMHKSMGYNYLAGEEGYSGGMMGGMMESGIKGCNRRDSGMTGWGRRGTMMGPGMMSRYWGRGFMAFPFSGIIIWVIVLALIGTVVYMIIRIQKKTGTGNRPVNETPLQIAQKRYARGEISRDEYKNIKQNL